MTEDEQEDGKSYFANVFKVITGLAEEMHKIKIEKQEYLKRKMKMSETKIQVEFTPGGRAYTYDAVSYYDDIEVGDVVLVPDKSYDGGTTEVTVVATESDYNGYMVEIVGIK